MSARKNYKVSFGSTDTPWAVLEEPTGLLIEQFEDCRAAKIRANVLNGGSGFNGYTPPFILNRWVLPSKAA